MITPENSPTLTSEKNSIIEDAPSIERLLEKCKSYSDIFELVKRSVKETLSLHRMGLMLVMADLPPELGAFHTLGSNTIVINRLLIRFFKDEDHRRRNEFTFLILLHEYLHALGYTEESEVRFLTYKIVAELFGVEHPFTKVAERGPFTLLPDMPPLQSSSAWEGPELIKDFERPAQAYIQ